MKDNYLANKVGVDSFDGMEILDRFAVDVSPTLLIFNTKGTQIGKMKGFYPAGYLQKELVSTQNKHNYYSLQPKENIVYLRQKKFVNPDSHLQK